VNAQALEDSLENEVAAEPEDPMGGWEYKTEEDVEVSDEEYYEEAPDGATNQEYYEEDEDDDEDGDNSNN
jgi:hypothetical protein